MELTPAIIEKFWSKVSIIGPNDCWLWRGEKNTEGYGRLVVKENIERAKYFAHRLSYCIDVGLQLSDITGYQILHSCDNPPCVNPKHLRAGTPKDNTADMYKRGRNANFKGEKHAQHKLTDAQVVEIRELASRGVPRRAIAKEFGVTNKVISFIHHRKSWSHIDG